MKTFSLCSPRTSGWLLLLLAVFHAPALTTARAEALIAYTKDRAIYTASAADGKNPKKICLGDDPCISHDGRFLAYTRADNPKRAAGRGGDSPPTRAILLRELGNGKETPLPAGRAEQVYGALWSADDRWIAFNALTGKGWQVAVVHPDGTGFHVLTERLDPKGVGYFLAGWNLHDKAILAQNLSTMAQLDPATDKITWQRPVKELTGEDGLPSSLRCMISADGKLLVSTRFVENDEIKNMDGPSSYLVLKDLPDGAPRRVTPPKFDAATPFLDPAGEFVLLRGFGEKDLTMVKGSDEVRLKTRIYRFDLHSGKLTPLIEGGATPSASRG